MTKVTAEISESERRWRASPKRKEYMRQYNLANKDKRIAYKKTEKGKAAEKRYVNGSKAKSNHSLAVIKWKYGLSADEYFQLIAQQEGRCAICDTIPAIQLHVDHCHTTEKVRGMLCGSCNRALGLFKENIASLKKAIKYLEEFETSL